MTLGLAAGLLAGCQDDPPPADLTVVTPPPSATVGAPSPAPTSPAPSSPAASSPAGSSPAASTPAPAPDQALAAYRAMLADRQRSRSAFFAAVSDGTPRTVAQQRQLAATHLAELRRFAAGVRAAAPGWPAPARAAARDLLATGDRQLATVTRMARATGAGAFTAALADYGVGVAAEERAIRTVLRALGG